MFPAKIIDRVTVTKTFAPDQPGSFTGGNINIVTKSFPDRPFATFEFGGAYNTQTTGNEDFLTYQGGSRDWLGMDDGTRALPSELSDFSLKIPQRYTVVSLSNPNTAAQRFAAVEELDRLTKALGSAPFGPTTDAPPLNHSFLVAAGDTTHVFGLPAGLFVSLPYSRSYSFYDDGIVQRHTYNGSSGTLDVNKDYAEAKGAMEVNWAATLNLALQLAPDHEVAYNFIFNQYAEDSARVRDGFDYYNIGSVNLNRLQFIERNLTTHQFKGGHEFAELGELKLDWLVTSTQTTQDEPDTRFYHTFNGQFGTGSDEPLYPARFFRDLTENSLDWKTDMTLPLRLWGAQSTELKAGFAQNNAEREFNERIFYYDSTLSPTAPQDFLAPERLGHTPPTTNSSGTVVNYGWPVSLRQRYDKSFYNGERTIDAFYGMLDLPISDSFRLIGGARVEQTDIQVTSFSTIASLAAPSGTTNTTLLSETGVFPAAGFIFSIRSNMNVRLNYGETVARPSFRELAGIRSYDPILDVLLEGAPELQITHVKNYDVRWEWFPRPGELFSAGLFYKQLDAPIIPKFVSANGDVLTYANGSEAIVYGLELEARKSLASLHPWLRDFSFGGNLSLIQSEMDVPPAELAYKRQFDPSAPGTIPLVDQSPYIINLDLTYDNPRTATTVSVQYNVFGPRLLATSLNSPDLYEQPAALLDVVVSQRIGRNLRLKLSAKNLLDPEIQQTYGEDTQGIYSSYTRGMTFGLSLNYEF
jgi:TonB-dependent receptor